MPARTVFKSLFALSLITVIASCQTNRNTIKDLINPVKVTAGKEKSLFVQDLFYAENYNLEFEKKPSLQINYDKEKNKLSITPDNNFEGITLLEFKADMNLYSIPIISKKENLYKFNYTPKRNYENLILFGSFNGWNRQELPMKDEDGDGEFEIEIQLEPGVYQYKFFGDGEEIVDPLNPVKVPNGFGDFNSVRTIEDPDTNKLFLHVESFKTGNGIRNYSFVIESNQINFNKNDVTALLNNSKIVEEKIKLNNNKITISLEDDELNGQNFLRVAVSKNGQVSNMQTIVLFDGKPADNKNFTWYDGIIYSLMIDRFNDGDKSINNQVQHDSLFEKANYMGGDLQGIINKLNEGYFDKLGINILWISPVYDNPNEAFREYPAPNRYFSGYHGYWPISPNNVEEKFGTMDKLKEVISTAHKHNIKVLLDFVSNHVHKDHPYFKEHRDWFGQLELPDGRLNLRFWDEFRLTTWFEPYLPSFDYLGSNEALEEMTNNAVWWLKETGADGFRHDAVKHVPNEFWRRLTQKLKKEVEAFRDVPVYQIGETFGSYDLISSYVNNGQLSSQFNFNLYDTAIPTFTNPQTSFSGLDKEMHKTFSVYGSLHVMGNIMDSHDKNRFMAYADSDLDVSEWSAVEQGWNNPPMVDNESSYKKAELYYAYMNSIPGLPVIYYGSEFGMSGASDPDNRRMMRFDEQLNDNEKTMLIEVQKIVNIRKEHPALRYGDFYTLLADENTYAFMRSDFNERILVVLNKNENSNSVELAIPSSINAVSLKDLISGEEINLENGKVNINADGIGWRMFLIK